MSKLLTKDEARAILEDDDCLYVSFYVISRRGAWCCCGMGCVDDEFASIEEALEYVREASDNFTKSFLFLEAK